MAQYLEKQAEIVMIAKTTNNNDNNVLNFWRPELAQRAPPGLPVPFPD